MKTNSGNFDFLKGIISSLCGIVFIIDLDTLEYTWGNNRYFDMLGYKEDEICMNTLEFADKYFHPDDKKVVQERIHFFRNNHNDEWSGVYRILHKQGHWVWFYSRVKVFKRNADGSPKLLLGEVIDAFDNIDTVKKIMVLLKQRVKSSNIEIVRRLTAREVEVIYHTAMGKTYKEIAERLGVSPETVNKHRKNVFRKLELNNIASLSAFAHENGLV